MTTANLPKQPEKPRQSLKNLRRRRCQNCNVLFQPVKEHQIFHSDNCRKEYHRYGSSYGPLRTGLHNAIDKKYADLEASIKFRFKELHGRIEILERLFKELRQEYERHTHEFYGDGSAGDIETMAPTEARERPLAAFRAQRDAALTERKADVKSKGR